MKKIVLLIPLVFLFFSVSGKSNGILCDENVTLNQTHYKIQFGDTIVSELSSAHKLPVVWNIFPNVGLNVSSGSGMSTGDLIFSQPGKYQITFAIPAHGDYPAKKEVVTVDVSDVRMVFDVENIKFSESIKIGTVKGVMMTIPVSVKTFNGSPFNYNPREIQTTGVANVKSKLKNQNLELTDGINEIVLELSGVISNPGNIQFRFYDLIGSATFFNYIIKD